MYDEIPSPTKIRSSSEWESFFARLSWLWILHGVLTSSASLKQRNRPLEDLTAQSFAAPTPPGCATWVITTFIPSSSNSRVLFLRISTVLSLLSSSAKQIYDSKYVIIAENSREPLLWLRLINLEPAVHLMFRSKIDPHSWLGWWRKHHTRISWKP